MPSPQTGVAHAAREDAAEDDDTGESEEPEPEDAAEEEEDDAAEDEEEMTLEELEEPGDAASLLEDTLDAFGSMNAIGWSIVTRIHAISPRVSRYAGLFR